jgi:hypothetical protein
MRRHLIAAAILVPAAAFAAANAGYFSSSQPAAAQVAAAAVARPCDGRCAAKWMDAHLRMDQMQVVGTAESYKQRPSKAVMGLIRMGGKSDAEALDFGLPPIAAQLDDDVRALAFDMAFDPRGGAYRNPAGAGMAMDLLPDTYLAAMARPGFKVMHVIDVDYNSSCLALRDCLEQVAAWSRAHPRHLPIVITLRTNDARTPMPGATRPVACDAAALAALDGEIRAVFHDSEIITPAAVQGSHASLRDAAMAHAWPMLGTARSKVVFVLDDSAEKAKLYQGDNHVMFVATDENAPNAAFISVADPVRDGARIAEAVKAGFMVITRADADTREARSGQVTRRDAAFASGAQVVQTDFALADPGIGAYRVILEDNAQAMCGKRLGSEHCVRFEAPGAAPIRTASALAAP